MKVAHACEGLGVDIEFHGPGPAVRQCMAAVRNSNYYEMGLLHPKATDLPHPRPVSRLRGRRVGDRRGGLRARAATARARRGDQLGLGRAQPHRHDRVRTRLTRSSARATAISSRRWRGCHPFEQRCADEGFHRRDLVTAVAFWILAVVLPSYTSFDLVTYTGDAIGLIVDGDRLRRRQRADRADRPAAGVAAEAHDPRADRVRHQRRPAPPHRLDHRRFALHAQGRRLPAGPAVDQHVRRCDRRARSSSASSAASSGTSSRTDPRLQARRRAGECDLDHRCPGRGASHALRGGSARRRMSPTSRSWRVPPAR